MSPADVDLRAYRGTPFVDVTDFEGYDYSEATFIMEVREYRDAPTALITLGNAISSAQGVSCTVDSSGAAPVSSVQIRINEATIEGLRFSRPRGGDLELEYALDVTGGGHGKTRRMRGKFIVEASANG